MATQRHLKLFENSKANWDKVDFTKVYREELGTAAFITIKPLIESITLKLNRTDKIKDTLSDSVLQQFYSQINNIASQLNAIVSYNEAEFVAQKQTIQNQVTTFNEQLLGIWPQIVAIINDTNKSIEIDKTLDEIQKIKSKTLDDAKNVEQIKESLTADLKSFEERYKNELFNKAEIIRQEDAFSKDAIDFKRISNYWFYGIIGTSILLVIILCLVFKYFCFELACFDKVCNFDYNTICTDCNRSVLYLEIFKAVVYRLFLISFILYLISICAKNYNANMHNYTVNKHKANSLSAALILLDKAKTDQGNDQLMTQAANAIFSHQPTGFTSKDPENITTKLTEKIIDKIKS